MTCSPRKAITEYPIRASAFQASACDLSGPIYLFSSNTGAEIMITSVYMCRQTDIHECVVCVDVVKWWTVVSVWWRLAAAARYYFKNQYYLLAMATDCLNKNKCVAHRCLGLFEHCVLVFRHIFLSSILDSFSFFALSIIINFVAVFIILPLNIKPFCSQKLVPLWLKR